MCSHKRGREKCLSSWMVHVHGVEVLVGSHLHSSVVHVMCFSRQSDRKIVTESLQRCSFAPQCQWKCQTPLSIIFSGRSPWWTLVYRLYLHWPTFSSGFSSPPVSYSQVVLMGTDLLGLVWWPENRLPFQSRIHSRRPSLWLWGEKEKPEWFIEIVN